MSSQLMIRYILGVVIVALSLVTAVLYDEYSGTNYDRFIIVPATILLVWNGKDAYLLYSSESLYTWILSFIGYGMIIMESFILGIGAFAFIIGTIILVIGEIIRAKIIDGCKQGKYNT